MPQYGLDLESAGTRYMLEDSSGAILIESPYAFEVLQDNPVSYWRLGEAAGSAVDQRNVNAGTYTGGFTRGQTGGILTDSDKAVLLDGTGYVRASQITVPTSLTWEAWIKPVAYPGDAAIVGQWSGSSGSMFYVTSDFGSRLILYVNANTMLVSPAPATGSWHHVAATYDGTDGRIYVDGALAAGPTALAGPITSPAVPLEIGTYANAAGGKFNSTIDEVAYYSSALSLARIQAHYAAAGY